MVAVTRPAGERGGFYFSHIRDEGDALLEAIAEAIHIGRETGAAVQISHYKAAGRDIGKNQLRAWSSLTKRGLRAWTLPPTCIPTGSAVLAWPLSSRVGSRRGQRGDHDPSDRAIDAPKDVKSQRFTASFVLPIGTTCSSATPRMRANMKADMSPIWPKTLKCPTTGSSTRWWRRDVEITMVLFMSLRTTKRRSCAIQP